MSKLIPFGVLLLGVAFVPSRCAGQATNVGEALGKLPGALLWNWKMFVLLPENLKDFNEECAKAQANLNPGQSKQFRIVMSVNLSTNEPVRFIRLEPADIPEPLRDGTTRSFGAITLTNER